MKCQSLQVRSYGQTLQVQSYGQTLQVRSYGQTLQVRSYGQTLQVRSLNTGTITHYRYSCMVRHYRYGHSQGVTGGDLVWCYKNTITTSIKITWSQLSCLISSPTSSRWLVWACVLVMWWAGMLVMWANVSTIIATCGHMWYTHDTPT